MAGFKVVYTESKFVKEMYVINISLHEISKVGLRARSYPPML